MILAMQIPVRWMDRKWQMIAGHKQADGDEFERLGWIIGFTSNGAGIVWARDDNSLHQRTIQYLTVVPDATWEPVHG